MHVEVPAKVKVSSGFRLLKLQGHLQPAIHVAAFISSRSHSSLVFEMKQLCAIRSLSRRCQLSLTPTEFPFILLFCISCSLFNAAIVAAYYPDYHVYHNLQAIGGELASLAHDFPGLVQLQNVGSSRQNRPITAVILSDTRRASILAPRVALSDQCSLPTVVLTSGEHAREFIPVEVLIALMRNLSNAAITASSGHAEILQRIRLITVPIANPDGRALLEQESKWCWRGMPNGVDINRNFPWEFGGPGSSSDPNNEEFKGPSPISEPESRAIASIFDSSSPAAAYASLHSGSQVIYTPYSDTASKSSHRLPPGSSVAANLAAEMAAQSQGFYTETGVVYEMNDYTADGTVTDWASATMKVPLVFTFEMFGDPKLGDLSNCFEQFNPESSHVSRCVEQQLPALLLLLQHVALNAELECQRRTSEVAKSVKNSSEASAAAAAQAETKRAHPSQDKGSSSFKEEILHDMQALARDLLDAQATLQHARLKLVASLKARGVFQ